MRKKKINPYRNIYQFSDARKENHPFVKIKGYRTSYGLYVGPAIIYNNNGSLLAIGTFNPDLKSAFRRIGLWKIFDDNGNMLSEEIYIN